jgi:N-acetylmuramoyl-L-alanine amidase
MIVSLDAGHGGKDKGCGPFAGFLESDLVWQIAVLMFADLPGRFKLIRPTEVECPSFHERARRAKGTDAALILHFNSGPGVKWSKTELYTHGTPRLWSTLPLPSLFGTARRYDVTSPREMDPKTSHSPHAINLLRPYAEVGIPALLLEIGYLNDPKVTDLLHSHGPINIAQRLTTWVDQLL